MSLASVAASSNPRRPKAFAVRSFPTFYSSATTAEAFPATAGNFIGDKNVPPSPLVTPPVPTSCGPGTDLLSYRGKILKPPVAFAIRKFPKGCGPLAASIPKPSDEASIDVARTNPEEGIDEKDAEKSNRQNSQTPDFVEGDRKFEGSKAITKVEEIAIRKFPKGCGPLAASIAKPSDEASIDIARTNPEEGIDEKDAEKSNRQNSQTPDFVEGDRKFEGSEAITKVEEMKQKLRDFVKRIPEERSRLGKISENALDGKSLGGEDVEKPNKNSSVIPDLVKDGKRFEKMEDELADDVRKTSNEGSVLVKVFKNSSVGTSLVGKEAEKPNRKSPLTPDFVKDVRRFYKAERSESKNKVEDMKETLNNVVRRISKEGNDLGKTSASDVAGRSLGEKDGKEPNRKRSLMPDSVENGRDEGGQLLEVRGDRLIVLALMAATRCPWMQGKGKSSIGFQSRQKKPRSRASG